MCKSMGSQRIQPCNTGENAQAASQFNTSDFNMAGEPKIVELDSDEEEIQEPGPKNAGVPAEAEKVNDAGDKVKESQPEPEPEEEDEEDEEGVGGGEYKRQTEGDIRKVLSDARASSKGLADLKAPKPKETPAEIKKKEREKAKENARKEKALARVQAQEEIVFADLFDLGLGKQATGCFMKVEIMEKVMDHWPNSKQIRVIDKTGDARSAFFYTDENEYFDLDDAKQGAVFTFRDPYLHYFMDGQMGLRIEDAKLVRLDPNASWKPQRRLEYAKAEKLEGNKWLKDKKWEEACSRYGMAVGHITDCPTANADEVAARSEVEKTIYLNMSLAFLSQEKFEETIKYCRKALDIDPKLAKAYFRMGQAQAKDRQTSQAEQSFLEAQKLEPNDKGIKDALRALRGAVREQKATENQLWKGLIQKEPTPELRSKPGDAPSSPTAASSTSGQGVFGGMNTMFLAAILVAFLAVALGVGYVGSQV